MTSTWRILLLSLSFAGIVGGALWVASVLGLDEPKKGSGYKRLSGTVAEGFSYRSGKEHFPRATCDACHVGKMKLGLVSLGAFNTIEFDNLVINMPERREHIDKGSRCDSGAGKRPSGEKETASLVNVLDLKPLMALARAEKRKYSGIRISGLAVNRMCGNDLRPVLKARTLKNEGKAIVLRDVVLFRDKCPIQVPKAELKTEPLLVIEWDSGCWDISDLLKPGH